MIFFYSNSNQIPHKRTLRFSREIQALRAAKEKKKQQFVVEIIESDCQRLQWKNPKDEIVGSGDFQFYLMESAECDLSKFLANNRDLPIVNRLEICQEILKTIKNLHEIEIYHRDIKPENFLRVNSVWKVSDLGLIKFRTDDQTIDQGEKKIGPFSFMTPEGINRYGSIESDFFKGIEIEVDEKSDVFQLGKLLRFILQGDIPNGYLKSKDLRVVPEDFFGNIFKPMLFYKKLDRPQLDEMESRFEKLYSKARVSK